MIEFFLGDLPRIPQGFRLFSSMAVPVTQTLPVAQTVLIGVVRSNQAGYSNCSNSPELTPAHPLVGHKVGYVSWQVPKGAFNQR